MARKTAAATSANRPGKWRRIVVWTAGVAVVLLVVGYFVATSRTFLRRVILPRVSQAMHAEVTVGDSSVSPFSEILLRNVKVRTTGTDPVLTADEVRAHYSLFAILRGHIKVSELVLVGPAITVVEQPDGTKNTDPLFQTDKTAPPPKTKPASSKPLSVDIGKVTLNSLSFRYVKHFAGGRETTEEISSVNLEIDNIKNGEAGKLVLSADARLNANPPPPATGSIVQARVTANLDFAFSADFKPASLKGNARVEVSNAQGALADLAAAAVSLDADVTPGNVKQLALRFQRGGASLGELAVSGPFDAEKTEGHLSVNIHGIDKQLLDLAGATSGIDFGQATVNSTNQVDITRGGASMAVVGRTDLANLQFTRQNQRSPNLDLAAAYALTVDSTANSALIRELTLKGTQDKRPLVDLGLTAPMTFAWGNQANAVGNSALDLTLTNLNLSDWKALLGDAGPSGIAGARVKLSSMEGGRHLTFTVDSTVSKLTLASTNGQPPPLDVTLRADGQAADLKQFNVTNYTLRFARQGQSLASLSGSATYDSASRNADALAALDGSLPLLLGLMPLSGFDASDGSIVLKAHVTQKSNSQTVTGQLQITKLTGHVGKTELRGFNTTADLDIAQDGQSIQIRKASGQLASNGNTGGAYDITGACDLGKQSGQINARLVAINQEILRPLLVPFLGGRTLKSGLLNAEVTAQYNSQGDSTAKANLEITNLVVLDPQSQVPPTALGATLQLDAALSKQVVDLRRVQLNLTPTPRAANSLTISGQVDTSHPDGYGGNLKIATDSFDITRYYDLLSGASNAPVAKSAPPNAAPQNQEPAPVTLPLRNFGLDVNIGRLYLREILASNVLVTANVDGGHVLLKKFELNLNGAPVKANADLDLGVPGWKYDVGLEAVNIPLAPLADSFGTEYRNRAAGRVITRINLKGAGITGENLRNNLSGAADLTLTNANIQLAPTGKWRPVLVAIATALRLPELLASPLDVLALNMKIGDGRIDMTQFRAAATTFEAKSAGSIPISPVLDDSPLQNLPVNFSIGRSIASRNIFHIPNDNTNNPYASLGEIARVGGTLGAPKVNPDYARLALLTGSQFLGGTVGGTAAGVIKGVGAPVGGIVRGIGNLFGTGSTNAPGTNQPPQTNSVNRSLRNLFK